MELPGFNDNGIPTKPEIIGQGYYVTGDVLLKIITYFSPVWPVMKIICFRSQRARDRFPAPR